MITLHTANTPNGQKPAILLDELGLDYTISLINISAEQQHSKSFRTLNPNAKIPALQDGELTVFESGAILMHLAETHGKFLPLTGQPRLDALAWSFWQVGSLGPMIGQWGHFLSADEQLPYAIERYLSETIRLFTVLDTRLYDNTYLVGEAYTIADMMSFPWAKGGLQYLDGAAADRLPELSAVRRWVAQIDERPAVQHALTKLDVAHQQAA